MADIPVFDSHVHVFPDAIAARVTAQLGADGGVTPVYDGSRAGLEACMRRSGVTGALNCPIATRPEQTRSINDWAAANNRWPMPCLGTVHPDLPDAADEVRRVHALGLHGLKLHPEYQAFNPEEARLEPIWAVCEELGFPVVIHAGADIAFVPPFRSSPAGFRRLLGRYPRLRLVAAHFGGWRMWEEVDRELAGMPLWLDLAFVFGEIPDERLTALIRRHGVDRILFGSDAPWRDPAADLAALRRLPLKAHERERILWRNAADLFRIPELCVGRISGQA